MKGATINNLSDLHAAALSRRAIICNRFGAGRPIPAAVMMNQQGRVLLKVFKSGAYVYEKFKPEENKETVG